MRTHNGVQSNPTSALTPSFPHAHTYTHNDLFYRYTEPTAELLSQSSMRIDGLGSLGVELQLKIKNTNRYPGELLYGQGGGGDGGYCV